MMAYILTRELKTEHLGAIGSSARTEQPTFQYDSSCMPSN